ncbi:conserved hypothetical protein [Tenacibaculum sediminilitoris]|uniref:hypothetical protein n=1 Tax=Tenacibaculum sediminilitoris TaxID=1820334 RepID=UPI0038949F16
MKIKWSILALVIVLIAACEAVFVDDISDKAVTVIAPKEGVSLPEGSISFLWERIEGAEKYQLQVANPNFENAAQVVLDTAISKNSFEKALTKGNYEWRVRAKNSEYETPYTSQAFYVYEGDITTKELVLTSPKDDVMTNVSNQTLSWEKLPEAVEYRLQIWKPDTNGTLEEDTTITNTTVDVDFSDGTYTWQVRPQSTTQNGNYVSRILTIDTVKPNTPENITPADASSQTETTVSFTWKRENIAGTDELDSLYVFTDESLNNLAFKAQGTDKSFTQENVEVKAYYWYVQAFDKAGNKSDKSNVTSFTVN